MIRIGMIAYWVIAALFVFSLTFAAGKPLPAPTTWTDDAVPGHNHANIPTGAKQRKE